MSETLIIRDDSVADTVVVHDPVTEIVLFDAVPGPAGRSITVHWSTEPPTPGDGAVGDLWVVTEETP